MNKNRVTPTEVGVVGVCTDFSCNNCKKKSNNRLLKIFAASGLAIMMGIGTLCGVLIAPMGATSASNAGDLAALAQSADRAQEKALHDAGVLSGGDLGLDPENDPVVWVTDNGFEIKSHNVAVSSGTTTVSSTSWKYVTLGSYNWIIIGYSTKELNQSVSGHVNINNTSYNDYFSITNTTNLVNKLGTDTTDAGSIIKSASVEKKARIYLSSAVSVPTKLKAVFTNAVGNTEIPAGCVLCLCAGTTGESYYDATSRQAYFPGSDLDTAMTTVYNNIKSAANNQIVESQLTTYWFDDNYDKTKYTHNEFLFPLASNTGWDASTYPQNYCVETYLNTAAKRDIDATWWLRSGSTWSQVRYVYLVNGSGLISGSYEPCEVYSNSYGVRPAFVLKLY